MPTDTKDAKQAGDLAGTKTCIFREIGPRGGKTKNYIALPAGRRLPEPNKVGNLWKPVSMRDLHARQS